MWLAKSCACAPWPGLPGGVARGRLWSSPEATGTGGSGNECLAISADQRLAYHSAGIFPSAELLDLAVPGFGPSEEARG